MSEPESVTQLHGRSETSRSKAGKGKAVVKKGKSETPSREEASREEAQQTRRDLQSEGSSCQSRSWDPQVTAEIQQRAYWLYEAGGHKDGHALEHWLEAERQITGSSDR
ncbi:MAG TPA: DUF2934 domain-containing protein [Nitrospira sp.]|jgi:hypothetical protein